MTRAIIILAVLLCTPAHADTIQIGQPVTVSVVATVVNMWQDGAPQYDCQETEICEVMDDGTTVCERITTC